MVSVVDVLPTILALLEIQNNGEGFDGAPVLVKAGGDVKFTPPAKPYIAELLIGNRSIVRATISEDWKYIAAQKWLTPAQRTAKAVEETRIYRKEVEEPSEDAIDFWGPVVHEELYNLSGDPREKENILAAQKQQHIVLKNILTDYGELCKKLEQLAPGDTPPEDQLSPEEIKRLRALGYL
jgi:arylsulfatase A-like enzyme